MDLIDERGRLFGRVNVIDALVVLLVVAVVAAGVALVAGGGGGSGTATDPAENETDTPPDTTVATVELGTHPSAVARLVEQENVTVNGHNATVTDVYRTPGGIDQVHLLARLSFDGNRTDRGFVVGEDTGNPLVLRYGTTFDVQAPDYQLTGSVLTIGDNATFETRTRQVVVNVSTTDSIASAISEGDTHRIAGEQVATVERAERTARDNETVYVELTLSVEARSIEGHDEYAGAPIRLGRTIPFENDQYAVRGTVIEVGT